MRQPWEYALAIDAVKNLAVFSDEYSEVFAACLEFFNECIALTAVNDKVIKSAGVAGVIKPGKTSVQVIVGTKVQFVADAFSKLCE